MPRVFPPIEGKNSQLEKPANWIESTSGFTAGVVTTLVVHPFDVIKTRLQLDRSNKSPFGRSIQIARDIVRNEGRWNGLYRGLMPNLIGNSVSWGLYFMWYNAIKDKVHEYRGRGTKPSWTDYMIAAFVSGVATALVTNPIWVIKTRMISTSRKSPGAYTTIWQGAKDIMAKERGWGFYRGIVPSLYGCSHGSLQFAAYETLKTWRISVRAGQSVFEAMDLDNSTTVDANGNPVELSNLDFLTTSAVGKIFAGGITYPYQVVRSRLQTYDAQDKYKSARDCARQIWVAEGYRGFYKGIAPNIVRVLPSTCVTFLVYENMRVAIPNWLDRYKEKYEDTM